MTVPRAHPTTVVGRVAPAAADPAADPARSEAQVAPRVVAARPAVIVDVPVEPRTAAPGTVALASPTAAVAAAVVRRLAGTTVGVGRRRATGAGDRPTAARPASARAVGAPMVVPR